MNGPTPAPGFASDSVSERGRLRRILARVVRVVGRTTYSYASCGQCRRKLVPASLPASSLSAPYSVSGSLEGGRRPLGDRSAHHNANTTMSHAGLRTATANPPILYSCLYCRVSVDAHAVNHRFSVGLQVALTDSCILKTVSVFGSSLAPAFGMSCSALHRALARDTDAYSMASQSASVAVDAKKVVNALECVMNNKVIVLLVKPSTMAAINSLTNSLEKSLRISDGTKFSKVAVAPSSSDLAADLRQKPAARLHHVANQNQDFVVSSIEFLEPPAVSVAHILGLLPFPPTLLAPVEAPVRNFPSAQEAPCSFISDSSQLATSDKDFLHSFTQDMRRELEEVDQPTIVPQPESNAQDPSQLLPRHELGTESRFISPPSTPRPTGNSVFPGSVASASLSVLQQQQHATLQQHNLQHQPTLPLFNSDVFLEDNIQQAVATTDENQAFELTDISVSSYFGIPSPPRQSPQFQLHTQQLIEVETTSHGVEEADLESNMFHSRSTPWLQTRMAALAAEPTHTTTSSFITAAVLLVPESPFLPPASRQQHLQQSPRCVVTLVDDSPLPSHTRRYFGFGVEEEGVACTPLGRKNSASGGSTVVRGRIVEDASSPFYVADTPVARVAQMSVGGQSTFGFSDDEEEEDEEDGKVGMEDGLRECAGVALGSPSGARHEGTRWVYRHSSRSGGGTGRKRTGKEREQEDLAQLQSAVLESIGSLSLRDREPVNEPDEELSNSSKKRARFSALVLAEESNPAEIGGFHLTQTQFNKAAAGFGGRRLSS
ncbi:hypothetical protein BC830DRAFT_1115262 [Chytriomyces sp. MP71]|nr:hypothetical protein BC830DRAFT_1115262 [Chytriomyces sp. MP71]